MSTSHTASSGPAPNERTTPTDTLAQGNRVRRRNPSRGPVGEGLHSHCADPAVSLDDLLAYIARVGPAPIKDRARGEPHPDLPDVIRIPVSHGRYALIDAEDYPLVMAYSWWSDQYAFTQHRFAGKVHVLRMHRLILMLGSGSELVTDHIDHDGLNNRKTNLRACIVQQNNFNGRLRRDSTTGVKGVTRRGARWRAAVKRDGVVHLACFDSENEAAAWARSQREKLHGEFACHE